MKRYLPLIALLTLISAPLVPTSVIAEETKLLASEILASEIDPELKAYARSISVKISSNNNDHASGVLIGKQGNQYLVVTNNHVIPNGVGLTIQTEDGIEHQANIVDNPITSDDDIALLTFNSNNNYQLVQLNSAETGKEQKQIYAVGYAAETGQFTVESGTIQRITKQPLTAGYRIGYTNNVVSGMSGGAIFDELGDLVGINGIGAFPILNTAYQYEDGTTPTPAEIEQFRSLSWGLSGHRLLTQLNPEIITAYGLPQPETTADLGKTELTGWLGDLETKAKQITVRIDSSSGANGSGVIIAQEGNTYTVLTADHVLCEQDPDKSCLDYSYEIVTPDGQKYPLDKNTVIRQSGVDLAVAKFTSKEAYQVAELASYPLANSYAVFVAGYPQLGNNTPPEWQFSLGYGLEKERGLFAINVSSNSSESLNSVNSQGSLPGGYEMVYTSITYGGMSGGAVLDREGRVIGIHGLAEGETAIDSQSGSSTSIQLGYSLGVPTSTFLGIADRLKIDSQLLIQERKPKALNSAEIEAFETAILGAEISQGNATPKRWLERGNQLWRLRRYTEAAAAFERAKKIDSEFIHLAHYGEGLALQFQGKTELALASLQQAINSNSKFAPAFNTKSSVLIQLNRLDEALIAIDSAIALEPKNANWYSKKGTILSDLKRYSDAEVADSDAINLDSRAAFYYNRGNLYDNQGEVELALADYNQAIKVNPQFAYAYSNRGNIYSNQEKIELALADYNQAIKINPQLANAYINRGNFYSNQGEVDLALADYNQAIKINPQLAYAYGNRGNIYSNQGKVELALADYNQAIKINPQLAEAYNNRGLLYTNQGEVELALADYSQAIEINPQLAEAYGNRGLLYDNQREVELALADYNQAIEINPQLANAYNNRGLLYTNQGEVELALADYNQVIKINPQLANAYNNRGLLYTNQGEVELALADYNQVIKINPQLAYAYNNRGFLYSNQGKVELALADYSQAIEINPQLAKAYGNRGLLYDNQGKVELALADYNQAIKINPQFAYVYNARGNLYKNKGKVELALADYNQVIKINPQLAKAYGNRGIIYANQGKVELALADFKQAIEIKPRFVEAYGNLGLLYRDRGDIQSARTNLQKAQQLFLAKGETAKAEKVANLVRDLEQTPGVVTANTNQNESTNTQQSEIHLSQGIAYAKQDRSDLALVEFNKAIEINPQDAIAYYNRGVIYSHQEKVELALADFNQVIKINPKLAIAYYSRGLLYKNQGKVELALADYNQAIEIKPQYASAYYNRGIIYKNQGKVELALADYNQAIKINPKLANAYGNLGLLYRDRGDIQSAQTNLQKAQQLFLAQGNTSGAEKVTSLLRELEQPQTEVAANTNQNELNHRDKAETYFSRGTVYFQQGKLELALTEYNKAIEINPQLANAYLTRGSVYLSQNKDDLALSDFNKAIQIDPQDARAYKTRGVVYLSQKKNDLALSDFSQAVKLNPQDAESVNLLGILYLQKGDLKSGKDYLETAQQLSIAQGNTALSEKIDNLLKKLP